MKMLQEKDKEKNQKNCKSARLIVRNLSFKCKEQSLKDHFGKFGEIVDVKLLKKGDKLVGCGFVQFENKLNAVKAIAKLSGKDFMGRPIIVDWALPKDKFLQLSSSNSKHSDPEDANSIKEEKPDVDSIGTASKNSLCNDGQIVLGNVTGLKQDIESCSEGSDEESENSGSSDKESENSGDSDEESNSEDNDEDSNNEDLSGSIEEHKKRRKKQFEPGKRDEEPLSKKIKLSTEKEKKYKFKYDTNDVSDGRTIFIKNIPFSVKDDDLLKCAEELGTVIYAVVCVDPLTEHSKGTGFVKYKEKAVVDELLQGKLMLTIDGHKLEPHLALKKNQIENLKEKKTPKDNRNLYLLREGVILAGSSAADGVSEGDMAKRLQLENWKTQTLRNLNKFVSPLRLVVHNLPEFLDDNQLREIFKKHSPKGTILKEVRIMRNLKDINENGVGRSKGFGFVSFTKHEHALEALRAINNNPNIFKASKRPIVGFSIENMMALKMKEKQKQISKDLGKKSPKNIPAVKREVKSQVKKKEFVNSNSNNLPTFSGDVAKPGVKKMRTRKELATQAQLHHQSTIEKKKSKKQKKNKFFYPRKLKSKQKGKIRTKK